MMDRPTNTPDERTTPASRYQRRLADTVRVAFEQACNQGNVAVAEQLVTVLDTLLSQRPQAIDLTESRQLETSVDAHQRLWHLIHRAPPIA